MTDARCFIPGVIFSSNRTTIDVSNGVLTNCPRCGYIAEAWIEGGIIMKVRCHLCGYQGVVPASPDLKKRPWRV